MAGGFRAASILTVPSSSLSPRAKAYLSPEMAQRVVLRRATGMVTPPWYQSVMVHSPWRFLASSIPSAARAAAGARTASDRASGNRGLIAGLRRDGDGIVSYR